MPQAIERWIRSPLPTQRLDRYDNVIGVMMNMTYPFASGTANPHEFWTLWESRLPQRGGKCGLKACRSRLEMYLMQVAIWALPPQHPSVRIALQRFKSVAHSLWHLIHDSSLRRFQREKELAEKHPPPSSVRNLAPIHIALIASVGKPSFGQKALATVRSALYFSHLRPLHFHFIVDDGGMESMQAAWNRMEIWLQVRGTYSFIQSKSLHRVWHLIHETVPQDCLDYTSKYGSVGWLRMFPHEIFRGGKDPKVVVWVDAGDYIFQEDPALLAQYHQRFIQGQVAMSPIPNVLEFQVFDLQRMRRANWTKLVAAEVRKGMAAWDRYCYLGEGSSMAGLARKDVLWGGARLWHAQAELLPVAWSVTPLVYFPGDGLIDVWQYPGRSLAEIAKILTQGKAAQILEQHSEVWRLTLHPGIEDFMNLTIHCPSFPELYAVSILGSNPSAHGATKQALDLYSSTDTINEYIMLDGHQVKCVAHTKGIHFVSGFHHVPWAHEYMNFWAGASVWDIARQHLDDKARDLRV